jgi:filamentous hemagglutinin
LQILPFVYAAGRAAIAAAPRALAAYRAWRVGRNALNSDLVKSAEKQADFFDGTKYTNKVKGQMKQDDFHSFPESVEGFQSAGKVSKITGGDGTVRDKLEIPGNYRGHTGNFEFIKEPDGIINHRLFRPD